MQTFLPEPDLLKSVKCLDYKRLGKQRVECKQILNILLGEKPESRWRNHPAVLMWISFEECLKMYMNYCIDEWVSRGYKNAMIKLPVREKVEYPFWFGDYDFHSAHRAALLYKNTKYYSQFGWSEPPEVNYVWPVTIKLLNSKRR